MKNISIILNVVLIIAVGILYFLQFSNGKCGKKNSGSDAAGNKNIVFVNTDSIWSKYSFVEDKKKELAAYEQELQNQYNDRAKAFEAEYKAYLKEGTSGKLSLAQQKKREEELGRKQQELGEMDKNLSNQFLELQQKLNNTIQDSIISYIKKQNRKNNYTYVLGYARNSGILFANGSNDITKDILSGLNSEYKKK